MAVVKQSWKVGSVLVNIRHIVNQHFVFLLFVYIKVYLSRVRCDRFDNPPIGEQRISVTSRTYVCIVCIEK